MTGPRLVLPRDSMPWGRWVEENGAANAEAIDRQRNDLSSQGSQFSSRADLLSSQIRGVTNVSTQYTYLFPTFVETKSAGAIDGPSVMLESPTITFNPPRPGGTYRALFICNMYATQTAGTGNLDFSWTYMSVGGRIYRQPVLEENRTGATSNNMSKMASVAAWEQVGGGDPTAVKIALRVAPVDAKTVVFEGCSVTAVYVGGI